MKKYIIGTIFGFLLAFSVSAHAEEIKEVVGMVVEGKFSVNVDGNKLENDAVVIDGTTYLPVRAFGEAIGYEVSFDPELGVKMEKKVSEERKAELEQAKAEREKKKLERKLETAKTEVEFKKSRIAGYDEELLTLTNEPARPRLEAEREQIVKEIAELEKEIADLEAQLSQ